MVYRNKQDLIGAQIKKTDVVLDVGFLGQGIAPSATHWPHALLKHQAAEVYGVDLELNPALRADPHYQQASAENFAFPRTFDIIFAGDLIEHLSNPGLFLRQCKQSLRPGGKLILTTPNAFCLFNLAEKLAKREPSVNSDHTCYFNAPTLRTLLRKNGFVPTEVSYLYTLEVPFKESWKKKILNVLYFLLSQMTEKFSETLVVVAEISETHQGS